VVVVLIMAEAAAAQEVVLSQEDLAEAFFLHLRPSRFAFSLQTF